MNKDLLQKRIQQIDSDIQSALDSINQLQANLNAMHGAKQDCLYWIEQLGSSNAVDPAKIPAPAASSDT
jgi:hypothetical protein